MRSVFRHQRPGVASGNKSNSGVPTIPRTVRSVMSVQIPITRQPTFALPPGVGRPEVSTVFEQSVTSEAITPSGRSVSGTAKQLVLRTVSHYLPHPDKVHYGGEDAHFISSIGGGAFGIADGVGGWADSGVNPAEYSRTLMREACSYLESLTESEQRIDPRGALDMAHKKTRLPGSATALVLQLDQENNRLVAANLGDSGFMVVRQGKAVLRSRVLQHFFDCPYQLGAFPDYVEATDYASQADLFRFKLQEGDVLVAGTDGLWDNAFEHEIVAMVPKVSDNVEQSAMKIAELARRHAADADFMSPYITEALSQGYDLPIWEKLLGMRVKEGRLTLKRLSGGKMDDITVLVALVEREEVMIISTDTEDLEFASQSIPHDGGSFDEMLAAGGDVSYVVNGDVSDGSASATSQSSNEEGASPRAGPASAN